jgi:hypothetical protein
MAGPHSKQVVPATRGAAVTKSDVTVLAATRSLYVGVIGNLTLTGVDGVDYVLTNVAVGYHPLSVTKVKAATTADEIVALY